MKCTFQVGDRVICVEGSDDGSRYIAGQIYTVRWVGMYPGGEDKFGDYYDPAPTIKTHEWPDRSDRDFGTFAYKFRPVKPLSFWLGEKQELRVKA